jgi:D-alanyl-D-alanine endopeptidase (penicillin-binding protein 7)
MFNKLLLYFLLVLSAPSYSQTVTAQSWIVTNEDGAIIQAKNHGEVRSIASITKLMSAMVVIDAKQDPNEKIGKFTRAQHIQMSLVGSSNESALLLCEKFPGGKSQCVHNMNLKAQSLGMINTKFVEATGLSPMNISTAEELVRLVLAAKEYPEIVQASQTPMIQIKIQKKWFFFKNTNPIIGQRHTFIVSKTGWTTPAGGCIVMMLDTEVGKRVVVVLGSKNTKTRIPEAEFIATYDY